MAQASILRIEEIYKKASSIKPGLRKPQTGQMRAS